MRLCPIQKFCLKYFADNYKLLFVMSLRCFSTLCNLLLSSARRGTIKAHIYYQFQMMTHILVFLVLLGLAGPHYNRKHLHVYALLRLPLLTSICKSLFYVIT